MTHKQPRRRAQPLNTEQVEAVLSYIAQTSVKPLRDYAIILFSFRAGLRVGEISAMTWRDVMDVTGQVRSDAFVVPDVAAKKGHGRVIPMHPALYATLCALKARDCPRPQDRIIKGARYNSSVSPNALQMYIGRIYKDMGFVGASSHSGRRTFITTLAQRANAYDCTLKDVQKIAGHAYLDTTEGYIVDSPNVSALVSSV